MTTIGHKDIEEWPAPNWLTYLDQMVLPSTEPDLPFFSAYTAFTHTDTK